MENSVNYQWVPKIWLVSVRLQNTLRRGRGEGFASWGSTSLYLFPFTFLISWFVIRCSKTSTVEKKIKVCLLSQVQVKLDE